MSEQVTVELLKGFLEAFNRHDLDFDYELFRRGLHFLYAKRFHASRRSVCWKEGGAVPALQNASKGYQMYIMGDDRHWVAGDFGVSEWTLTGTSTSGQPIEVRGVDLLEFAHGKITRKDLFGKY